jgi:hypothetical protein
MKKLVLLFVSTLLLILMPQAQAADTVFELQHPLVKHLQANFEMMIWSNH